MNNKNDFSLIVKQKKYKKQHNEKSVLLILLQLLVLENFLEFLFLYCKKKYE